MRVTIHLPGCYSSPIYIERCTQRLKTYPTLLAAFTNMVLSDVTKTSCNRIIFSAKEKKMDLDHSDWTKLSILTWPNPRSDMLMRCCHNSERLWYQKKKWDRDGFQQRSSISWCLEIEIETWLSVQAWGITSFSWTKQLFKNNFFLELGFKNQSAVFPVGWNVY